MYRAGMATQPVAAPCERLPGRTLWTWTLGNDLKFCREEAGKRRTERRMISRE